MKQIKAKLKAAQLVPVVVLNKLEDALPLAQSLINAKLPIIEITFRTACAAEAIKLIKEKFPQMIIGAGTILTEEELVRAKQAGANFCVSPGLDPILVKKAEHFDMPFIPGVSTASDLIGAINCGCYTIKFFPAEAAGGISMLKSLLAAFGHLGISVMPTGGINEKNYRDYLAIEQVLCVGSSWIVDSKLIAAGNFKEIENRIANARETPHV